MNEKKNSQIIRPFGFFIRPFKKKINKIKFSEKKKIRPFRNIFFNKKIKFFAKKKNTSFQKYIF